MSTKKVSNQQIMSRAVVRRRTQLTALGCVAFAGLCASFPLVVKSRYVRCACLEPFQHFFALRPRCFSCLSCALFRPLPLLGSTHTHSMRCATRATKQQQADDPLISREGALTGSQTMRGPYINSGSRDVGPDPDWDLKRGTYKGRKVDVKG